LTKPAILAAALASHAAGLSVMPPKQDGSKRPFVPWDAYKKKRADEATIKRWYKYGLTGLGWICGAVSGNLEVIDFDDRSIYSEFKRACNETGLTDLIERIEQGYTEHSPNGAHWPYFCDEIAGNLKLAKRADQKALIETRGEGGYIITAPTFGGVNKGGVYKLTSGSIETIARITPDERQALHDLARVFDEVPARLDDRPSATGGIDGGRPGDDYAAATSWAEILEPHGWVRIYGRLGVDTWRRPGKGHGVSATTNYQDSDLFYCFSSSTPFEPERGYGKFAAYAILNHAADFEAAANELSLLGHGQDAPIIDGGIDISALLERKRTPQPASTFPAELLRVPGLVGETADWILETSCKPQPVFALAASIAAVATAIGRKVMTENLVRPNVYILAVGDTGCGKDRPRSAIRTLFIESGGGAKAMYDEMASDAGIISAIEKSPCSLFLFDEIGHTFTALAQSRAPTHLAAQVSLYIRLYSLSDQAFFGKSYADKDKITTIYQPCLSIYGATVPTTLWSAMTTAQISDGFLARFLVFETDDQDPPYRDITSNAPPTRLLERFAAWEHFSPQPRDGAGNLEAALDPNPLRVPYTPGARAVFTELELTMREKRASKRAEGDSQGIFTRVALAARKLALIRACGITHAKPEITARDAMWGAELATYLYNYLDRTVRANVADSQTERVLQAVMRVVNGGEWVSLLTLGRKLKSIPKRERDAAIATLQETGSLIKKKVKTDGRPAYMFKSTGH
jgi:hypothetical protein